MSLRLRVLLSDECLSTRSVLAWTCEYFQTWAYFYHIFTKLWEFSSRIHFMKCQQTVFSLSASTWLPDFEVLCLHLMCHLFRQDQWRVGRSLFVYILFLVFHNVFYSYLRLAVAVSGLSNLQQQHNKQTLFCLQPEVNFLSVIESISLNRFKVMRITSNLMRLEVWWEMMQRIEWNGGLCHGEQKANSYKWEKWPQNVCCCCCCSLNRKLPTTRSSLIYNKVTCYNCFMTSFLFWLCVHSLKNNIFFQSQMWLYQELLILNSSGAQLKGFVCGQINYELFSMFHDEVNLCCLWYVLSGLHYHRHQRTLATFIAHNNNNNRLF